MPSKIQRIPSGLLSFLGIKGTGQNPDFITDDVVPSLETLPFYAVQNNEIATTSGAVQNAGDQITLVVPSQEVWLLHGISAIIAMSTTATVGLEVGVQPLQGGNTHIAGQSDDQSFASGQIARAFYTFGKPTMISGGSTVVGGLWESNLGFGQTMNVNAWITRMAT